MNVVLPRLSRDDAVQVIARFVAMDLTEVGKGMPHRVASVTYSPVGGGRVDDTDLRELRASIVEIARDHGMPNAPARGMSMSFDGRVARFIHSALPMTPHEASYEEVWSYLTCCWLLDVAMWRFGHDADDRRFIGNVNRNTFRRLWWRAEILGPEIDLARMGEDELVNIMERPTIASDRRLARAIATEFLHRVEREEPSERMKLMRDVMKRLLRLTPFVSFSALDGSGLQGVVADTFDSAIVGMGGRAPSRAAEQASAAPRVSPDVTQLEKIVLGDPDQEAESDAVDDGRHTAEFSTVAQAALAIARRTGRVTNATLREAVPITSEDARHVLKALTTQGLLISRGVRRGTHYVIPDAAAAGSRLAEASGEVDGSDQWDTGGGRRADPWEESLTVDAPPVDARRPADAALRRLLRRRG